MRLKHLSMIIKLPLRGSYKTKLYSIHLIPKLRFQLGVHDLPSSSLLSMDAIVRIFLRKCNRFPNSTNLDLLLHSKGFSIRLPTFLYDHGHVINETAPSHDIVKSAIREKTTAPWKTRISYQSSITSTNRNANAKNLKRKSDETLETHAENLSLQGEWHKLIHLQSPDSSFSALVSGLSEATYRWLVKACTNTVPTMSYLYKIGKKISSNCPRCGNSPETLHHSLNSCRKALEDGLYTWRHNMVLDQLYSSLQEAMDSDWEIRADLSASTPGATVPPDILLTQLKPDIITVNKTSRRINLVELTVCWDVYHHQAQERKEERYTELAAELKELNGSSQFNPNNRNQFRAFSSNQRRSGHREHRDFSRWAGGPMGRSGRLLITFYWAQWASLAIG